MARGANDDVEQPYQWILRYAAQGYGVALTGSPVQPSGRLLADLCMADDQGGSLGRSLSFADCLQLLSNVHVLA